MRRIAALAIVLATVAPAAARASGLRLVARHALDPRLSELTFRTPDLSAPTRVRILLPRGYADAPRRRYPVLYLLHGAYDDETSWTKKGDAEALTARLPLIVVMPDGGIVGNYTNWFNHGAFGLPRWEAYHVGELIPWVDAHLRTVATRAGRAVAGLSMGGGGAMKYAASHPDLFAAAAAFSGAVDTNDAGVVYAATQSGILDGDHRPGAIFGDRATETIRWRNENPTDLAENLRGLRLWVFTGNGEATPTSPSDGVEADVHSQSLSFHRRLTALHIAHRLADYGPGAHRWVYWTRDLKQTLPGLMRVFAHPAPSPSPFSFRRADPRFTVFGWTVAFTRPAMEWGVLRNASATGFALSGSGRASVVTAPLFAPRTRLSARIRSASGTGTRVLRADARGRIHIAFRLGPGNARQEYTAMARTRVFTTRVRLTRLGAPRPR
jgi:S-formylglutathione hydrolase FrmB